jgi:mannose-1-phosphate guanylyltransferase
MFDTIKRMIVVIIAGGSGTRLWPLSTNDYPKHLLKLTDDKSLLQNTYARAKLLTDNIYIVPDKSHSDHILTQLPELPSDHLLVEPGRRGTASCVVMALAKIKSNENPDEPIVFMHADHHIRDNAGFTEALNLAAKVSKEQKKLVLLGLEPTYPATGFGYIERGDHANSGQVYRVTCFKEKPDYQTAEEYVKSGKFLWNMGYFVATLNSFERSIKKAAPQLWRNYQKLLKAKDQKECDKCYLSFKAEPIDTALIERLEDTLVMPGTFDWMDVGSFPDVHLINVQDDAGNTLQGKIAVEGVSNSFVRNDTDKPVVVIGLDNVAVVSTPDGILVVNKSHAQKVGEVSKRLK